MSQRGGSTVTEGTDAMSSVYRGWATLMVMTRRNSRGCARPGEAGFTLIEVFVVLAVLGVIISLAIPRYLSARKHILIVEADNVLQELRTLAWSYYLKYGTWEGLDNTNVLTTFGFVGPDDADSCWDYGLAAAGSASELQLQATGDDTPIKCTPVNGGTVTLTLNGNGSASRSQNVP